MSRTCNNCGEQVKQEDVFCPFCGNPADKPQASSKVSDPSSSASICATCGASNKQEAQFCESCGNSLATASSFSGSGSSTQYQQDTSYGTQTTHTYGTYSAEPSDRKWYTPPQRTRSARHPLEWFFWSGWGLYILIRFLFSFLWIIIRIIARSKGGRF